MPVSLRLVCCWLAGLVLCSAALPPPATPVPRPAARAPLVWHAPHDPLSCWAISPDFARDRTLFLACSAYAIVLRSRDGGATFQAVNSGLPSGRVQALAISPDFARDGTLFAADAGQLFRSTDGGDQWRCVEALTALEGLKAIALSPAFAQDRTLAVGAGSGVLLVSRDAGDHWQPADLPVEKVVAAIAFSPDFAESGTVFARVQPNTLVVSRDGGKTFAELAAPPCPVLSALLVDDRFGESGTLWVGSVSDGVWRSEDCGTSWSRDGGGDGKGGPDAVLHLAAARDEQGRRVLFAATVGDGIHVRTGDGSWTRDSTGLRTPSEQSDKHYFGAAPSPAFAQDHTVYAITFEGLHVSRQGGLGWEHCKALPETFSFSVAFSPRWHDDGTLFVTTNGFGTLRSRDGGQHWQRLNSGAWAFPDGIAIATNYPDEPAILVGSPRELLISRDDGATFANCVPDRVGFLHLAAFAPDYASTGTIYAQNLEFQHPEHDVFLRSDDRGLTWTPSGPSVIHALAFAPDFARSGRLYAATEVDVQVSDDRGRRWRPLTGLPPANWMGLGVAAGSSATEVLLAASANAGVFLSEDGGASWKPFSDGLEGVGINGAALSPDYVSDGLHFASAQNEGLFVRGRADTAWRSLGLRGQYVFSFTVSRTFAADRTIAAATYAGPWLSRDGGATWKLLDLFSGAPGVPPPSMPAPPSAEPAEPPAEGR